MSAVARFICTVSLVLTIGCGSEEYGVVPVSGTVTLDGQPLADAQVSFEPTGAESAEQIVGPGSFGRSDGEGRYKLETVWPVQDGAAVGAHRVRVTTAKNASDADNARLVGEKIPRYYLDDSVRIVRKISEPTDSLSIELFTDFRKAKEAASAQ
jgi:hypothetical protein